MCSGAGVCAFGAFGGTAQEQEQKARWLFAAFPAAVALVVGSGSWAALSRVVRGVLAAAPGPAKGFPDPLESCVRKEARLHSFLARARATKISAWLARSLATGLLDERPAHATLTLAWRGRLGGLGVVLQPRATTLPKPRGGVDAKG